jgi:hypothetical protein
VFAAIPPFTARLESPMRHTVRGTLSRPQRIRLAIAMWTRVRGSLWWARLPSLAVARQRRCVEMKGANDRTAAHRLCR